jgi:hypothetical protein
VGCGCKGTHTLGWIAVVVCAATNIYTMQKGAGFDWTNPHACVVVIRVVMLGRRSVYREGLPCPCASWAACRSAGGQTEPCKGRAGVHSRGFLPEDRLRDTTGALPAFCVSPFHCRLDGSYMSHIRLHVTHGHGDGMASGLAKLLL